jgi:hypothetical protein
MRSVVIVVTLEFGELSIKVISITKRESDPGIAIRIVPICRSTREWDIGT